MTGVVALPEKVASLPADAAPTVRRIEAFTQRFGKAHLIFAYHAAFPITLTADLLYCLWANFQRDNQGRLLGIPWIAVYDLLLSGLVEEVGPELYEMDRALRDCLVQRLQRDDCFGQSRVEQLSEFLLTYVRPQLESNDLDTRDRAQAQRWSALAYVQPKLAARELASALSHAYENERADLLRITSVVETLAGPLAAFQKLLAYARAMASLMRGDWQTANRELNRLRQEGDLVQIAGATLPLPNSQELDPESSKPRWLIPLPSQRKLLIAASLIVGIVGAGWTWMQFNNQLLTGSDSETATESEISSSPQPSPDSFDTQVELPPSSPSLKSDLNLEINSQNPLALPNEDLSQLDNTAIGSASDEAIPPANEPTSNAVTSPDTFSVPFESDRLEPSLPEGVTLQDNLNSSNGRDNEEIPSAIDMDSLVAAMNAEPALLRSWQVGDGSKGQSEGTANHSAQSLRMYYGRTLRKGNSGAAVTNLQNRLSNTGYYSGPITGYYGELTRLAVRKFQVANGLGPDGVAGPTTLALLIDATANASQPSNRVQPLAPPTFTRVPSDNTSSAVIDLPFTVIDLQKRLESRGFYLGPIDGQMGSLTEAAIQKAQEAYGVPREQILEGRF